VYVINAGKIIAHGSPTDLRAKHSQDELRLTAKNTGELTKLLKARKQHFTTEGNLFAVAVPSSQVALEILKASERHISDFEFRHGTMDDVFLQLTNEITAPEEDTRS
jgi:multidrug/hemolysin transport system ATP-binding protein